MRSTLFREACKTISIVILHTGEQTTAFTHGVLPELMMGLQNTKAVQALLPFLLNLLVGLLPIFPPMHPLYLKESKV